MAELDFARQRLSDALATVIRLSAEERVRLAYQHGYKAGQREAMVKADRVVYRRGYMAGYKSGKKGAPACPDGAPSGRRRLEYVFAQDAA